jgi:hypothetical protein
LEVWWAPQATPIEEAGWAPETVSIIWRREKFSTLLGLEIRPVTQPYLVIILAPLDFAVSKLNSPFFEL